MATNDGGPAFARSGFEADSDLSSSFDGLPQAGMSLRDYLAGQAIVGILANQTWTENGLEMVGITSSESTVRLAGLLAYAYADAMLKAREG